MVLDIRKPVALCRWRTKARRQLDTLLKGHQLTLELNIAAAFDDGIVARLHIDRMTATAWERRIAAYAELDRLRATSRKPGAPPQDQFFLRSSTTGIGRRPSMAEAIASDDLASQDCR